MYITIIALVSLSFASDLGAHVDGFIGVVAHTLIVGASSDNKVKGRNADLLRAAHTMAEAALRKVKPDTQVGYLINILCREFECAGCLHFLEPI